MLEARKNRFVETALAAYNRNLIRRRFSGLGAANLDSVEQAGGAVPLLFYSNHSSWWDGAVAFAIWHRLALDCYVMMEERQLKKLGLFRRIGAFSVVRENPREAAQSVRYAARILSEKPNRAVWLFPQGEILPNDVRPLKFFRGLSRLVEKTGACLTIAAAMRYEFLDDFKPEAFVRFGEPELIGKADAGDRKLLTERFSRRLTATLDELKKDVTARETKDYAKIV